MEEKKKGYVEIPEGKGIFLVDGKAAKVCGCNEGVVCSPEERIKLLGEEFVRKFEPTECLVCKGRGYNFLSEGLPEVSHSKLIAIIALLLFTLLLLAGGVYVFVFVSGGARALGGIPICLAVLCIVYVLDLMDARREELSKRNQALGFISQIEAQLAEKERLEKLADELDDSKDENVVFGSELADKHFAHKM